MTITANDPIAIEGTNCWTRIAPANSTTWSNWVAGAALSAVDYKLRPEISDVRGASRWYQRINDLTVNYEIGGTATNGVQYATLPGNVTIPAGEHSAIITVVPIDDGPPEINMTVILNIKSVDELCRLALARRAAAYILDGPQIPAVVRSYIGSLLPLERRWPGWRDGSALTTRLTLRHGHRCAPTRL